ncbi:MAG: hypothetical protein KJO43_01400, partial [Phycisphaerae bacterium]|nr:hypothetical protein [Phycisphaerae bacterium]
PGGSGDDRPATPTAADIETLAPMPGRPPVYPKDTVVYRVPITFEIEIIDPNAEEPKQTASIAGGDGA